MSDTLRKCDCNFRSKARNYMCSCRDNDCGWEGEYEPSMSILAEGISDAQEFDPPVVMVTKSGKMVTKLAPYTMKGSKFVPLDILLKRLDRRFKS